MKAHTALFFHRLQSQPAPHCSSKGSLREMKGLEFALNALTL